MRTTLKVIAVTVVAVVAVALAVQYNIHTYQQPSVDTIEIDCGNRGWSKDKRNDFTAPYVVIDGNDKEYTIYVEEDADFDQCEIIE